jgi:hypothetical protein
MLVLRTARRGDRPLGGYPHDRRAGTAARMDLAFDTHDPRTGLAAHHYPSAVVDHRVLLSGAPRAARYLEPAVEGGSEKLPTVGISGQCLSAPGVPVVS